MQKQDRLHALDAVRAFALLLGIVLHAAMSFVPGIGTVRWPIVDNSPSTALGVTFLVIHIFRMTTFFMVAGFFARMVFHRKGVRGFVIDRGKRILVPLVVGWIALIPLTIAIMFSAASKLGKPFRPPAPADAVLMFPLAYLWFLYVLLVLYVLFLSGCWVLIRLLDRDGHFRHRIDTLVRWMTRTPLSAVLLALPVAVSLYTYKAWYIRGGIPTPDYSLVPNLPAMIGYGTAFAFGWLLQRQPGLLRCLERQWVAHVLAALVLTAICLSIAGSSFVAPSPTLDAETRMIYAASYCVASWCWTLGITGAALRFLSNESPTMRYLADSSYWLYLLHIPLVFALQVIVMQWNIHWSIKFPLILTVAGSLLVLSYHYFVRSSYIGEVLNGRRYARSPFWGFPGANSLHDAQTADNPLISGSGGNPSGPSS